MFKMDPSRLRETLEQLEQAGRDHAAWQEDLLGKLLCVVPGGATRLRDDGHRRCRFGRWYHENAPDELRQQPAFEAIGQEHRLLHAMAGQLLQTVNERRAIRREDYDELASTGTRLRLALDSLRHEIQAALRHSDPVTGAYDRAALMPELREWHELAKRGIQQCCIAFMDLDRFKEVNDTHGHLVGDEVLAGAARCITAHLRPYDKLFRYGGDEFLILLPATDLATGHRVMERIRRRLAATPLVPGAGAARIRISGSFGLAMLDPATSIEESVDRGDTALLLAKSAGRNRVVTWDPAVVTQRAFRRLDLEHAQR